MEIKKTHYFPLRTVPPLVLRGLSGHVWFACHWASLSSVCVARGEGPACVSVCSSSSSCVVNVVVVAKHSRVRRSQQGKLLSNEQA